MKLVIATHNDGKLFEFQELLKDLNLELSTAKDHGISSPLEDGKSFEDNARIKAHHCANATGFLSISDDSGIEVDLLDGAPGIYTADWAETVNGRDFYLAMEKVRLALKDKKPPFKANFTSVLCVAWPDGTDMIFRGEANGHLEFPPRGSMGFGYDPIFVPDGYKNTFAELQPDEKNRISHRQKAFDKLLSANILK